MTKKFLFVSVILLALVAVAIAADSITGKWVYDMPAFGRGGGGGGGGAAMPARQATLDLKADGMNLTGSVTTPGFARGGGDPPPPTTTAISNGKVNGDSFSFDVTRQTQNGDMTTKYEGSVSGSEMKLKTTSPGYNGGDPRVSEVVAKKN